MRRSKMPAALAGVGILAASASLAAFAVLQPSFTATTVPAISGYAVTSIRIADIDGDGIGDLVTTENSGSLVIRYLDASGQVSRTFRVSGFAVVPKAAAIADFNADGRPDLAVVDSGNNQSLGGVYVLLQSETGTFGTPFCCNFPYRAPAAIITFRGGQDAVVADVNEDGHPDLLVPSNSDGHRLFLGNGSGLDATPSIVHASTFNNSYGQFGDVNGDGHLDLVVNNVTHTYGSSGVHVQLGAGDGTFGAPATLGANLVNQALAVGDLNADGRDDIVVAGASYFAGNKQLAVYLAQADGTFSAPARMGVASNTNISRVALADLNGDGTLDIVSSPGFSTVTTFLNDGTGAFTAGPSFPGGSVYSLTAGAVRPGAFADIFAGSFTGPIAAYLNGTIAGDATAPAIATPGDLTVEASGPGGANVTFVVMANDDVDGEIAATCSPASGTLFALGTTTVSCTAADEAGNEATAPFTVTVVDTTAPELTLPEDITTDATSPAGAVVTFAASAWDLVDGSVAVTCTPASGTTFVAGTTAVSCSATDASGNTASGTFTVTVRGAGDLLDDLFAAVQGVGPGKSLAGKIGDARVAYAAGDIADACDILRAFLNEVRAQSGKKLAPAVAADLTARATVIRQILGC